MLEPNRKQLAQLDALALTYASICVKMLDDGSCQAECYDPSEVGPGTNLPDEYVPSLVCVKTLILK